MKRAELARFCGPLRPLVRSLDAPRPWGSQQVVSGHEQIGQRTGHEQSVGVLLEPSVAHLHEAEDALEDADGMLDLGPYTRLSLVLRPLGVVDDTAVTIAPVGEVLRAGACSRMTSRWPR